MAVGTVINQNTQLSGLTLSIFRIIKFANPMAVGSIVIQNAQFSRFTLFILFRIVKFARPMKVRSVIIQIHNSIYLCCQYTRQQNLQDTI